MHQTRWRSLLLRTGKDLRPLLNGVIARYSAVGDDPVLDPALFPWSEALRARWRAIRREAERVLEFRDLLPSVTTISPDHARITEGRWKSFFLYGYGIRCEAQCALCPETARALEGVPGLESAFFSILEPGDYLRRHCGPTRSLLNFHLGLIVPRAREDCQIRLDGELHHWDEGELLVFDDTYRHEVWNMTNEPRVVLFCHVRRPVRFPGSLVSRGFLEAIKWSPFVRDARRNQIEWTRTFEAALREAGRADVAEVLRGASPPRAA